MIQSRQIEAFRAVMLTGAVTAAAELIHVSQPAVSRLIRSLEAELRLTLFQRRGNLVTPTAQAVALLDEVERSFVGLRQIQNFADDLRSGQGGMVRVAALPSVAAGFLPRFVARFGNARPKLRIAIDGLPASEVREGVDAGRIDVGVAEFPIHRNRLAATPLDDKAVVAMPLDHPLAARSIVRADDLRDETLILPPRFFTGESRVEIALRSVNRRSPLETPLATMACVLALEGAGVAIVDPFSASEFVGRGLALRAFEPAWVIGTAVIHSRNRPLSIAAREFLTAFIEHSRAFLERAEYLRA